jgi:hypothetical protein
MKLLFILRKHAINNSKKKNTFSSCISTAAGFKQQIFRYVFPHLLI